MDIRKVTYETLQRLTKANRQRMGTNLKIGIVGLPNVDESTFFNELTASRAAEKNFSFLYVCPE